MNTLIRTGLGVAVALALCGGAQAQMRGGRVGPSVRGSTSVRARVVRVDRAQTTTGALTSDPTFFPGFGFGSTTISDVLNGGLPVPGLGFDFAHQAIMNRDIGVRALIDPVTQGQLALARAIRLETPITNTFPFFPFSQGSSPVIIVQQPPVVIMQQPAQEEARERFERVRQVEPEARVAPPPEPLREVPEYVLVRRDGAILSAVAYSAEGDRLIYITKDGLRKSVALAELDVERTRRINEDRGTTLRLPVQAPNPSTVPPRANRQAAG